MFVTEDGAIVGSVNYEELGRLVAEGKVNVDALDAATRAVLEGGQQPAEKPEEVPADEPDAEPEQADESEDLSKLHKADLVERAEAAGIDPAGMTKAELVDALEEG